jgi:hypothetical protein
MRFQGSGAVLLATSKVAAEKAECLICGAALSITPVELQRIA